MADFPQSRNYPPNHLAGSGSGSGLFWVLFVVAVLGVLVLVGAFGGGSTPVAHPGGAGAESITVPTEPAPLAETGATIVE